MAAMAVAGAAVASDTPAPAPAASAKPASAAPSTGAKEKEGTFTLVNKTTWEIAEVRVTPAEDDAWSENLLKHKLPPNATAKMTVVCDETDVKLVDPHGHVCVNES